jgi:hypothetical protein
LEPEPNLDPSVRGADPDPHLSVTGHLLRRDTHTLESSIVCYVGVVDLRYAPFLSFFCFSNNRVLIIKTSDLKVLWVNASKIAKQEV